MHFFTTSVCLSTELTCITWDSCFSWLHYSNMKRALGIFLVCFAASGSQEVIQLDKHQPRPSTSSKLYRKAYTLLWTAGYVGIAGKESAYAATRELNFRAFVKAGSSGWLGFPHFRPHPFFPHFRPHPSNPAYTHYLHTKRTYPPPLSHQLPSSHLALASYRHILQLRSSPRIFLLPCSNRTARLAVSPLQRTV